MRKGRNGAYTQSYNAQASVEAEGSQLIVSAHVSQSAADTPELEAGINNIATELGRPERALADSTNSLLKHKNIGENSALLNYFTR